jgi:hypothetical protein
MFLGETGIRGTIYWADVIEIHQLGCLCLKLKGNYTGYCPILEPSCGYNSNSHQLDIFSVLNSSISACLRGRRAPFLAPSRHWRDFSPFNWGRTQLTPNKLGGRRKEAYRSGTMEEWILLLCQIKEFSRNGATIPFG